MTTATPTEVEGLYVHVPFCKTRCSYCAFYITTRHTDLVDRYLAAVEREAEAFGALSPSTVYFGGGTPTRLEAPALERLCSAVRGMAGGATVREWTIEANPATLDDARLEVLRAHGVNRVSIGAQFFNDAVLKRLGRTHGVTQIRETVARARAHGMANINLDLIACIPGVEVQDWRDTLAAAIALEPEHVSVYALSIEEGAALNKLAERGRFSLLDDDGQLDRLHEAVDLLGAAGLLQYEISNFARPGFECVHHVSCWSGGTYLGLGPSAASHAAGRRWQNVSDIEAYVKQVEADGAPQREIDPLTPQLQAAEKLLLGLRMNRGVAAELARGYEPLLAQMAHDGLLAFADARWRLTSRGRDLADHVAREILAFA